MPDQADPPEEAAQSMHQATENLRRLWAKMNEEREPASTTAEDRGESDAQGPR